MNLPTCEHPLITHHFTLQLETNCLRSATNEPFWTPPNSCQLPQESSDRGEASKSHNVCIALSCGFLTLLNLDSLCVVPSLGQQRPKYRSLLFATKDTVKNLGLLPYEQGSLSNDEIECYNLRHTYLSRR